MLNTLPMAVMADIHGNAPALKAVLADIEKRGLRRMVNLGDTFFGPLDPKATWKILQSLDMPTVLGNQDRILLDNDPSLEGNPTLQACRQAIGKAGLDWLKSLPATITLDNSLLCHGTPADDTAYLLEDVTTGLPAMRNCEAILADIMPHAPSCTLILAGHSHHAGLVNCGDMTVINPGSVGLPAYDDDTPPHVMASGSPHARYAIVSPGKDGWQAEFVTVDYDWELAARMAEKAGRDDWARWLRTGIG